jgi:hypothetical protein
MTPDLHVVEKVCRRTPGALKRLQLIDPRDLDVQPDWHLVPNVAELVFLPGKAAYDFPMKTLNARLSDNTNTGQDGGDFFEYSLEAKVRTVRIELETLRAKLRNRRIHVVATYYDGSRRLLPGIRLTAAGDSADRPAGQNAYSISGRLQSAYPAPYIASEYTLPTVPVVPPSTSSSTTAEVLVLPITTTASSLTQSIPSGALLIAIWISGDSDQEVSIGLTSGGDELGGPQFIEADTQFNFAQALRTAAATDVFLTGLDGNNTVEFWYAFPGEGDVVKISIISTEEDYEFILPSGVLLTAVWVRSDAAQEVSIGLTDGGDELGGPQSLAANEGYTFAQTLRANASTSIFITGMAGNNSIEIWYAT